MSAIGRMGGAVAALVVGLAVAACGGDDDDDAGLGSGATDTTAAAPGESSTSGSADESPLDSIELTLTEVAEADTPTSLVTRPGTDGLYVSERAGLVRPLVDGALGEPIVDIVDEVVTNSEQGLLDIEFSPDGNTLYLSYNVPPDGDTRIAAYTMAGDTVDPASRRELLAVDQPFPNHKGGDIEIGPDGFLYIGLGDGGAAGDPMRNGQNTSVLLGKILRIDPQSPAAGREYGIPPGNPFADGAGGAPEVWAYGLRNPWRFAFDPRSNDLWIADVGQNAWEEISVLSAAGGGGAGANLGWDLMEGSNSYEGGANPDGGVLPVFEYDHGQGCSITGGLVYRGTGVPGLAGAYLFTDYCQGTIRAIRVADGALADERVFEAEGANLVSFGEDAAGEAYVLSLDGPIYRLDPAG
ncbi:MAG TPA: PQQ-dependent sugar dehydrogenase [Acidimicrobiales bacterium]|nr:PQQ-dependent sugar dehydrogenase [Acidimicrobiales bacterium]